MHENLNLTRADADQSVKPSVGFPSATAQSARPTALVDQADFTKSAKPTPLWPAQSIRSRSSQIGLM